MKIEKFDFAKHWDLVEPHLNDPLVLDLLDHAMLGYTKSNKWRHLPLWNRADGIGPWEYSKTSYFKDKALDKAQDTPEYKALEKKYSAIAKQKGATLYDMDDAYDPGGNPELKEIADSYYSEFHKIQEQLLPKENTYQWYQCILACHYLAPWEKALAEKVFPNFKWHIYSDYGVGEDGGHSTVIGTSPDGEKLIFDILLFDKCSVAEILESAGLTPNDI